MQVPFSSFLGYHNITHSNLNIFYGGQRHRSYSEADQNENSGKIKDFIPLFKVLLLLVLIQNFPDSKQIFTMGFCWQPIPRDFTSFPYQSMLGSFLPPNLRIWRLNDG
jgi:hypothetical protein